LVTPKTQKNVIKALTQDPGYSPAQNAGLRELCICTISILFILWTSI